MDTVKSKGGVLKTALFIGIIVVIGILLGLFGDFTHSRKAPSVSSWSFTYSGSLIHEMRGSAIYRDLIKFSDAKEYVEIEEQLTRAVVIVRAYKNVGIFRLEESDGRKRVRRIGEVRKNTSSGTAFFISSDGYLITNRHVVVDPTAQYYIYTDSDVVEARVVFLDPDYDLAIIKVSGNNFPVMKIAENIPDIGDQVTAIGNAFGRFLDSTSTGSIIGFDREIISNASRISALRIEGLIETSAPLYPGDSGGPLLSHEGKVIGVNVAVSLAEPRSSFAIPAAVAKRVIIKAGVAIKYEG